MKSITVDELIEALEIARALGKGNYEVVFRDWTDIDHEIEGIYDDSPENEVIVLG